MKGKDKIGVRVAKVLGHPKVAKHFHYEISEDGIAQDTAMEDGIYGVRTHVSEKELDTKAGIRAYNDLSELKEAVRVMKDVPPKDTLDAPPPGGPNPSPNGLVHPIILPPASPGAGAGAAAFRRPQRK